ncbi:MAG: NAD(P)H-hydrate dehydratase [Oscillospiraceae bacterium]|nr:NAD(P)H-hydrate dehydratase [Oscillospiraceae bacterium]
MALTTAAAMREADRRAIEDYKIPSITLMERASRAVAAAAIPYLARGGTAVALCGSGNNGGDGLGAAVELRRAGFPVRAVLAGSREHATPDWLEMEQRFAALGGAVEDFSPSALQGAVVVIDALFGVGLNRSVGGAALDAIEAVNAAGVPVVAADIASGVEADTGRILGAALRADATVTFSMAKPGHMVEPGCVNCGRLEITDIGIPAEVLSECERKAFALEDEDLLLPRRKALSHKGDYGKLLILGGSAGCTGAPTLCARAAVRSGAGLVYLGVPAPIYEITAVKNDEAMPFALEEGAGNALERLRGCSVCAAGPGLGRGAAAKALVSALLAEPWDGALVLDADALNALAERPDWRISRSGFTVLTPHEGEYARLGGTLGGDRIADARDFALRHGCALVLKGHRCLAAFPDGTVYVARPGNPGMAKGGSGDVLTGILAAMLGQFPGEEKRAVLTALELHALAGKLCREKLGEYAMTASDLIGALPEATKAITL